MSSRERPSSKLLALLGVSLLLAGGYYGRALLGGGASDQPEPDPWTEATYDTVQPATTDDPGVWVAPPQPRNPFQAVPLSP